MTQPYKIKGRRYHHGDLRNALLAEAEAVLEREGIGAVSLRAVAREVGVSHTAPNNHFGDLNGLLSDLAAVGYECFAAALTAAAERAGEEPETRRLAVGRAYVAFAKARPEMFALMFHHRDLDSRRSALAHGIAAAREALRGIAGAQNTRNEHPVDARQVATSAAALWSLVHGFATLLIDGRLDNLAKAYPGRRSAEQLFEAVMASIRVTSVVER